MDNKTISEGRFSFVFPCIDVQKADTPQYNGLGGVDFVVETTDKLMFIEIKDLENPNITNEEKSRWISELKVEKSKANIFLMRLGVKFKDTVLRYWGNEKSFDKPIHYIVLIEFKRLDSRQKAQLADNLTGYLPTTLTVKNGFSKTVKIRHREVLTLDDWKEKYKDIDVKII